MVFVVMFPSLLIGFAGTPTTTSFGATSLVTTAPAPVFGSLADFDRGDQHGITANENIFFYYCWVLRFYRHNCR